MYFLQPYFSVINFYDNDENILVNKCKKNVPSAILLPSFFSCSFFDLSGFLSESSPNLNALLYYYYHYNGLILLCIFKMYLLLLILLIIVLLSDGSSEIGARVRSNLCYFICIRHLI